MYLDYGVFELSLLRTEKRLKLKPKKRALKKSQEKKYLGFIWGWSVPRKAIKYTSRSVTFVLFLELACPLPICHLPFHISRTTGGVGLCPLGIPIIQNARIVEQNCDLGRFKL
jgi:hypothetical protein